MPYNRGGAQLSSVKIFCDTGTEWIELERAVPSGYCQYNLKVTTQTMLKAHVFIQLSVA